MTNSNVSVTLIGVTLGGGMAMPTTISMTGYAAYANVYNGLTLDDGLIELGGAAGTGNYARLNFGSYNDGVAQTVAGTGTIQFGLDYNGNDGIFSFTNATVTFAAGITIEGGLYSTIDSYYANPGVIDNQGAIKEDTAGGLLTINANNWVNDGSVEVSNGATATLEGLDWSNGLNNHLATITATGATLNLYNNWINYGTITVDPSTVGLGTPTYLSGIILPTSPSAADNVWTNSATLTISAGSTVNLGGLFSTDTYYDLQTGNPPFSGDTVNLVGTVDNSGLYTSLDSGTMTVLTLGASTGPLNLKGGVIYQGTVVTDNVGDDLMATGSLATLDGVTLEGTLDMTSSNAAVTLNAVTLGGGMAHPSTIAMTGYAAYANVYNGLTLDSGLIELGGAAGTGNYARLYFGSYNDGVTQTVAGTGTIQFGQDNNGNDGIYSYTNATLTFHRHHHRGRFIQHD